MDPSKKSSDFATAEIIDDKDDSDMDSESSLEQHDHQNPAHSISGSESGDGSSSQAALNSGLSDSGSHCTS